MPSKRNETIQEMKILILKDLLGDHPITKEDFVRDQDRRQGRENTMCQNLEFVGTTGNSEATQPNANNHALSLLIRETKEVVDYGGNRQRFINSPLVCNRL